MKVYGGFAEAAGLANVRALFDPTADRIPKRSSSATSPTASTNFASSSPGYGLTDVVTWDAPSPASPPAATTP